ncbi:Pyroglutamyl-peptidase 1 [Lunasporangiospora selenospora]|uniref:Pyroglutamyl-peptidase 1 n=1 Tax=Lunasporangiospora selenospora TaxID=979761 RepID=A0A9P6G1V5_9FUNG|nr:Pyroglutamyl-peptidase 1 [Lunasporangiospora selenospora]
MAPIKRLDRVRVILTGFEPFGKHVTNPSWLSVQPLSDTTLDIPQRKETDTLRKHEATKVDIVCHELPVEYRKAPEQQEYLKTYFIHVGVGKDGQTAIETQAHRTGYGAPDNSKWNPDSKEEPPVKKPEWAGDADKLITTVDSLALAEYLKTEKGWICEQSLDAGHYLCEYTFYLSMAERQRRILDKLENEDDRTCLFVHLPSVGMPYALEELQQFIKDMVVAVVSNY